MEGKIKVLGPDNPRGTTYRLAPPEIAQAICRRFEQRPVAVHPTEPGVYIYDPGNFWDGPKHVKYDAETGTLSFTGWGGFEAFPVVGPLK